jgi:hypothetical protein
MYIELLLADSSTKHALDRVNNVLVELQMNFMLVDFIIMDMDGKVHSPIILGRPFLRTIGATIDGKEWNAKFHLPHT